MTAVYNVERYLPEFIASIESQRFDLGRVEVVAVDDGSPDGSAGILHDWARRRPGLVKVVSKPNGGQASARNAGLEHATGEWVTFSDPDDLLAPGFFAAVERFAARHPAVEILGVRPIVLDEATGNRDEHPRAAQYDRGNRRVDLRREPNTFPGGTNICLFRLDRVRSSGTRFDERLRPVFEDVHFTARYLMGLPKPVIGIVADATYVYRRRSSNDSTLQTGWSHPGRFTDVLQLGHLDLLHRARATFGSVPAWVQHLLIYDLSWYLSEEDKTSSQIRIPPGIEPRFHDLLCQILVQLEPGVVRKHSARRLRAQWSDLLAHACRPGPWHSAMAARTKVDAQMGLQRVAYRFAGDPPREEFLLDGVPVRPAFAKTMGLDYFGRTFLYERFSWLPAASGLALRLDGRDVLIRDGWPRPGGAVRARSLKARIRYYLRQPPAFVMRAVSRRASVLVPWIVSAPLRLLARTSIWSGYRGAWVLMDRVDHAGDNAERLFEHLRAERPDINAWFVIERGSPDWRRMHAATGSRTVALGSFRWQMLMLNCAWLVSSHADATLVRPPEITRIVRRPTWKLAFLGHGIMQADLSTWLNQRDLDLFVLTTEDELASVATDGTPYRYTAREARRIGMPRLDRLLALGRAVEPEARDLVILAPTWRKWLTAVADPVTGRRAVDPTFFESDYLRHWMAIVRSPEIAGAAARRGLRVAFMPHPNFQPVLPRIRLPDHVLPLTFADNDVQALYARTALLVTDYSSVAFDTAMLDRPVVYYQFDRDELFGGGHIGGTGYFDYERHGFGPVATGPEAAVAAIVAAIEHGPCPTAEYQARIDRTFTERDGQASARVVAAIEELSRPYATPADPAGG